MKNKFSLLKGITYMASVFILALLGLAACELNEDIETKLSLTEVEVTGPTTVVARASVQELSSALHPEFGFCYSASNQVPTTNDFKALKTGGIAVGSMNLQISGLTPGTRYYFRAFILDENVPVYSEEVLEATTPVESSAITLQADILTESSVILNGMVHAGGIENTVSFEYGTSTSYGFSVNATPLVVSSDSSMVSARLTNLDPSVTYHYRLKAESSFGIQYGGDVTFVLGTSTDVYTLLATDISTNSAILHACINAGGLENTVKFECGVSEAYGNIINAVPNSVSADSSYVAAELYGLNPGTNYYFRVVSTNANGTFYGQGLSFTTLNPVILEDGLYIMGGATALIQLSLNGKMANGINEIGQVLRAGMYELYFAISASSEGFNLVEVSGENQYVYGPANMSTIHVEGSDQPTVDIQKGTFGINSNKFTVPADGFYHLVLDKQSETIVIIPVPAFGLIGSATELGWSGDYEMAFINGFSLENIRFEGLGIPLRSGDFKLRQKGGWKMEIAEGVKCNTNFGGVLNFPYCTLIPGGSNYTLQPENEGVYTVTMDWSLEDGLTAYMLKTADLPPLPEYPEAMFLVGAATAYGWELPGNNANAIMHKCAGGTQTEGIFWKIAYIETGIGFKLSAAAWTEPNIGYLEVDEFDASGIAVGNDNGSNNLSISESGMYMVVLDLRNQMVKVSIKPAEVFGIGDAFGGWDEGVAANKFAVDNSAKTLISPALSANGNIRMYAAHSWIPYWWNAEFRLNGTSIEYRNDGGDQEPVAGTMGQIITLHFDDNTGSIQ